jgi:hypothetical protein
VTTCHCQVQPRTFSVEAGKKQQFLFMMGTRGCIVNGIYYSLNQKEFSGKLLPCSFMLTAQTKTIARDWNWTSIPAIFWLYFLDRSSELATLIKMASFFRTWREIMVAHAHLVLGLRKYFVKIWPPSPSFVLYGS